MAVIPHANGVRVRVVAPWNYLRDKEGVIVDGGFTDDRWHEHSWNVALLDDGTRVRRPVYDFVEVK
jgi:hypothetical protein